MEYQALQLVASLEHYGVEWHWARDAHGQRLAIGVGPEGIAVCKEDFSLVNRYLPTGAPHVAAPALTVRLAQRFSLFLCFPSQGELPGHPDRHPVWEDGVPDGYQGYKRQRSAHVQAHQ